MNAIDLTVLVWIFSIAVLLPVQLVLCVRVRSLILRLLPALLFAMTALFFVVLAFTAVGSDNLGYLFLAIYAGIMLLMCGIAWGIWGLIRVLSRKKPNHRRTR